MWTLIKREPVAFQGVVQAALAVAAAFGVGLDAEQIGALLAVTAAILSFVTRIHVTPTADPRATDGTRLMGRVVGV